MSNARIAKSIRSAVDEIIAQNDAATLTAVATLVTHWAKMEGAVSVSTTKRKLKSEAAAKPARGSKKAVVEEDDEDLDLSDDDDEELDDEDEEEAPKSRRSKKTPAKPARGRKAVVEEDDEDEDDAEDADDEGDDDGEMPELSDLSPDSIYDYLGSIPEEIEVPEHISAMGNREAAARAKELNGNVAEIAPKEGNKLSERTAMLHRYISEVELLIDAVAAFGYDDISEAYTEHFEEDLPAVKGSAKVKAKKAAEIYVLGVVEENDEEGDDE